MALALVSSSISFYINLIDNLIKKSEGGVAVAELLQKKPQVPIGYNDVVLRFLLYANNLQRTAALRR